MKITKTKLRQIIKEEIKLILESERYVYRRSATAAHPKGELRISGEDWPDEPAGDTLDRLYWYLKAGEEGEYLGGIGADDPVPSRSRAGGGESFGGRAFSDSEPDPEGFGRP